MRSKQAIYTNVSDSEKTNIHRVATAIFTELDKSGRKLEEVTNTLSRLLGVKIGHLYT